MTSRTTLWRQKRKASGTPIVPSGRGKHGNHRRGETHPKWNGGKTVNSDGYVKLFVGLDHHLADPIGFAYEHRIVAEKMIGRRLTDGEIVHHRNGNRSDNRPDNLEIMSLEHHSVKHASEIKRDLLGRFTQ